MRFNRCCILAVIFLFCGISILPSKDIIGIGYGNTRDAAKANAYDDLASQINVSIESSTYLSIYDDGQNSDSQLIQKIEITNSSIFPYIESKEIENDTDNGKRQYRFAFQAFISESSLSVYRQKTIRLIEETNQYNNEYREDLSLNEKLFNLSAQFYNHTLYSSYETILSVLGYDILELPKFDRSRFAIQQEYYSLLSEAENKLSIQQEATQMMRYSTEEARKDAQAELEAISKRLSEVKEAKTLILADQEQKEAALRAAASEKTALAVKAMEELSKKTTESIQGKMEPGYSISEIIDSIENDKAEFANIQNTLRDTIATTTEKITEEMNNEIAKVVNEPYSIAEKDRSGNPIKQAKELRESEINDIKIQKEKEIETQVQRLKDAVIEDSNSIREIIYQKINTLNSTVFTLDTLQDDNIILGVDLYDGESRSWVYTVNVNILGKTFSIDGEIPYYQFTEKQYDLSDSKQYEEYIDQIELYNLFIISPSALRAEVTYTVTVDANDPSIYYIAITNLKISRLDNNSIIGEQNNYIYQKYSQENKYELRTDDEIENEKIEAQQLLEQQELQKIIEANNEKVRIEKERQRQEQQKIRDAEIAQKKEEKEKRFREGLHSTNVQALIYIEPEYEINPDSAYADAHPGETVTEFNSYFGFSFDTYYSVLPYLSVGGGFGYLWYMDVIGNQLATEGKLNIYGSVAGYYPLPNNNPEKEDVPIVGLYVAGKIGAEVFSPDLMLGLEPGIYINMTRRANILCNLNLIYNTKKNKYGHNTIFGGGISFGYKF